jgi:hypothetical protein
MISYYRKCIPNCSKIASLLHKLLKKDVKFECTEAQKHAFQYLKTKLTTQPVLEYPDLSREFILTTDASDAGLGVVLLPILYASRSLIKADTHYTTSEKKFLTVAWATRYFRPYLYERRFKILTDHKHLTWVINVKDLGSRLLRWRIQLEEYQYEIIYKRRSENTYADALSRIGSNVIDVYQMS